MTWGTTTLRRSRRAARHPRTSLAQLEVWRDYRALERRHGRMLRSVTAGADGPRMLIVSRSEWPYTVKIEGLLAKALELHGGYVPVVMASENSRWEEPYFRVFGIERFVYESSYQTDEHRHLVEREVRGLLERPLAVQAVKEFRFRDANVGIQTLSTVSRHFQQGRISLDDPEVRAVLERILRQSMLSVLAAEAMLDDVDPELVLFLEKSYAGFGSIYDVALNRGANVIQFGHSGIHWHDALNLKRFTAETRRVHPAGVSQQTWERVRTMPWTEERERELAHEFDLRYDMDEKPPDAGLQHGRRITSPEETRSRLGLLPGRKTAVIFSHILWDANLFFGDDLFDDQESWLVESVKAACENAEVDWLVKLHPSNLYKAERGRALNDEVAIREAVGELPDHVKLVYPWTELNTYSLFQIADYGVTIRGTVGVELPCFGVPVLVAGTGRYSGLGFTKEFETAEQYLDALRSIQEIPRLTAEETLLAKRHAYTLFRLRAFPITSFRNKYLDIDRLVTHPLGHNLEITLRSARELREAEDLRRFADWAVDRSQLDFVGEIPES